MAGWRPPILTTRVPSLHAAASAIPAALTSNAATTKSSLPGFACFNPIKNLVFDVQVSLILYSIICIYTFLYLLHKVVIPRLKGVRGFLVFKVF